MTLTEGLAEAEQRARTLMTVEAAGCCGGCKPYTKAIDRYAAVCRLAGRWEALPGQQAGDRIAADLARLMEGCP